jgi:hypothetical protein
MQRIQTVEQAHPWLWGVYAAAVVLTTVISAWVS